MDQIGFEDTTASQIFETIESNGDTIKNLLLNEERKVDDTHIR
jgi:hypothetical protein